MIYSDHIKDYVYSIVQALCGYQGVHDIGNVPRLLQGKVIQINDKKSLLMPNTVCLNDRDDNEWIIRIMTAHISTLKKASKVRPGNCVAFDRASGIRPEFGAASFRLTISGPRLVRA